MKKNRGTRSRPASRSSARDAEAGEHWRNALILEEAGRFREAAEACRRVVELQPRNVEALCKRGLMLRESHELEESRKAFERALKVDPRHVESNIYLAMVYRHFRQTERALECYERAAWLDPRETRAFTGMAGVHEQRNELDEAQEAVARALAVNPENPTALVLRARLHRRQGRHAEAAEILRTLVAGTISDETRFRAGFELGRNLEKLGDHAGAFEAVREANTVHARVPSTRSVSTRAWIRLLDDAPRFTPELLARWRDAGPADDREAPVFLVGFPRSGTTMTEQILSAHPDIGVSDEQDFLSRMYRALLPAYDPERPLADQVDGASDDQILAARRVYREQADRVLAEKPGATLLIDKNPTSIVVLALLTRVFPGARVIVALRDPRDVCLSCFFQEFIPNPTNVYFNDLEKTLEMYSRIMDVWLAQRETLGLPILEWRYEEVTEDFEASVRRLIEFVGRPWDDAVLRFHEDAHRRYVSTPSYEAVASPVHTRARGRWRNYEAQLAPILPGLAPYVRALGYED